MQGASIPGGTVHLKIKFLPEFNIKNFKLELTNFPTETMPNNYSRYSHVIIGLHFSQQTTTAEHK